MTLPVIIAAFEDGPRPFTHQTFGGAFDAELGLFGFGVEEDYLADAAGYEGFFVDGEFGEGGEEFALDVVGGERTVGERFEEEADAFEEVIFWVYDGGFNVSAVAI